METPVGFEGVVDGGGEVVRMMRTDLSMKNEIGGGIPTSHCWRSQLTDGCPGFGLETRQVVFSYSDSF